MKKYRNIVFNRLFILEIFVGIFFLVLAFSLYYIIYQKSSFYEIKLVELTEVIVEGESAPRGRIYDRNYRLLVDNVSVPIIYYQKSKNITVSEEISLAYSIGKKLDVEYQKLLLRNLKEFYLAQYPDKGNEKITLDEWEQLKRRELTLGEIEEIKISRITEEELGFYQDIDKEAAYLYYLMNSGYSYDEKVLKKENVTDEEFSYFSENSSLYPGVDTKVTWEREYLYDDVFRSILGNIGSITKENKSEYLSNGYQLTDRVGTSNLELQYEDILKGTKARYLKKTNSTLEKVSDAIRGNDIVLISFTISSNFLRLYVV